MLIVDIPRWVEDGYVRKDVRNPAWSTLEKNFFERRDYLFDFRDYDRYVLLFTRCLRCDARGPVELKPDQCAFFVGVGCTTRHVLESVGRLSQNNYIVIVSDQIRTDPDGSVRTRTDLTDLCSTGQDSTGQDIKQETSDKDPRSPSTDVDPLKLSQETEKQEAAKKRPDPSQLMELWNEHRGPSLSAVQRMTGKRKQQASLRLREVPSTACPIEYWSTTIKRLASSPFATGNNDRGWKATFDWLIANDTNHVKVSEGRYDSRKAFAPVRGVRTQIVESAEDLYK